jgi:DNA-binding HxlR family transcriptional regulator
MIKMAKAGYKQFCPVAMASEILCARWTMVLLRELVAGSSRFNELRRGVPKMSPTLLSQRLKSLEEAGIIERHAVPRERGVFEYHLTESGRELRGVVEAIGFWGQRWVKSDLSLENLDVSLLMWDMRRNLNLAPIPSTRKVIEFVFPELSPTQGHWWLIIDPIEGVDLCSIEPGFDIDLYVTTDLKMMTSIWMGLQTVSNAIHSGALVLDGEKGLIRDMQVWLGLSPFAVELKRVD